MHAYTVKTELKPMGVDSIILWEITFLRAKESYSIKLRYDCIILKN